MTGDFVVEKGILRDYTGSNTDVVIPRCEENW